MSDGSRVNLYGVAESAYGTTPTASPALLDIRHTGFTGGLNKETLTSEEAHQDRHIRDYRHGQGNVAFELPFELSYDANWQALLASCLCGSWNTDVLKAGTTRSSWSFIRHFADQGSGKPYHIYTGCELNTLTLSLPLTGLANGSFGVIGANQTPAADLSSLTTPSLGTPSTFEPMTHVGGTFQEGGSGSTLITELSLTLDNGMASRGNLGSAIPTREASINRSNLTGNVTFYFENATLYEKYLNETSSSLSAQVQDPAGNSYTFLIPNIVYGAGHPDTSGGGEVLLSLPFQALYSASEGTNLQVTRAAA